VIATVGRPALMRWAVPVLGLALLVSFPLVASPYLQGLGVIALLYATVAASWDVTLGYAGVFNFGHLAFFGIGAYTAGILTADAGVEPWLGLVAGAVVAAIASVIVYVPVSRLRGIYVALITFAFAQLVLRFAVSATDLTGGELGLAGVAPLSIAGVDLVGGSVWSFYLAAGLLVISIIALRAFVRSDYGISLLALRDAEAYAISRGMSVGRSRVLAFVVSALFTGAAGAIYTYYLQIISPEVLDFSLVTLVLSMVLLGGAATLYGPVVAAIILGFADELLAPVGPLRFVIVSALVLLTILLFPSGMWGGITRRPDALRRRRTDAHPSLGKDATGSTTAERPPATIDPADGRSAESSGTTEGGPTP